MRSLTIFDSDVPFRSTVRRIGTVSSISFQISYLRAPSAASHGPTWNSWALDGLPLVFAKLL
jgi:hypothetical protein